MKWFGLTGGIACGKTTVADRLRSRGFPVIDADKLAREVVEPGSPGLKLVAQEFGSSVIKKDGQLDRVKLAELIFQDPKLRIKLESITHPLVRTRTEEEKLKLLSQGCKVAFYDVPLLFEKNMTSVFDAVVVVACDEEKQKSRLMSRSQLKPHHIEARIQAQLPLSDKVAQADFVIENNGSLEELDANIEKSLSTIKLD